MSKDLSAPEAARILDVCVATLYSYVSRGLLTPISCEASRSKLYRYDEVQRLAARNGDARRGGQMAVAAMNWGLPVLETHISHIADGRLTYRGYDVIRLADEATLETAACLLWDDSQNDYFASPLPALPEGVLQQILKLAPDLPPLARAMALLPVLAGALPSYDAGSANCIFWTAPTLMRLLAAILLKSEPSTRPLHQQVALAWGANAAEAELIRAALVLLADHDLNASTFAVRCVASTGAQPSALLSAGLAALSGPRHGGGSEVARQMLAGAIAAPAPEQFINNFCQALVPELSGFGHPLYPSGDPRAAYLLARLSEMKRDRPQVGALLSACSLAGNLVQTPPNCDIALAAMELACGWPEGAGITLFALSRSAGWIAHAAEQLAATTLIRPRARYVGRYR